MKLQPHSAKDIPAVGAPLDRPRFCALKWPAIITALLLTTVLPGRADGIGHIWSRSFGDHEWQFAYDVDVDHNGNVAVTGSFFSSIKPGWVTLTSAGGQDIYLVAYREHGSHIFSKRFGDASDGQFGIGVEYDHDGNLVLVGSFLGTVDFGGGLLTSAGAQDMFVAKFDAIGNHIWSKRFGDAGDHQAANGVAIDQNNDIVITGHFESAVDFGGGPLTSAGSFDVFALKLGSDGSHVWSKRFGDSGTQDGFRVEVDSNGNPVMTGYFFSTIDFGGGVLPSAGDDDVFVAKLNAADGTHVWSRRFGGVGEQRPVGVAVDSEHNVILAGYFHSSIDFGGGTMTPAGYGDIFLAKLDSAGMHVWSRSFGNESDYERVWCIAADSHDNILIAGELWQSVDFGGGPLTTYGWLDVFAASFRPDAAHIWSDHCGDNADLQCARGIASDNSGNTVIAGYFLGTVDFGGGPLDSDDGILPNLTDVFVANLGPTLVGSKTSPPPRRPMLEVFPNPFNPNVQIAFELPAASRARLDVYDARGRPVRNLYNGHAARDRLVVTWNGCDETGVPSASGVYFVRLETEGIVTSRKIVLAK
jgi:hypothetical protein